MSTKNILNVKSQTVYGELGVFPLKIKIQIKVLKYWARLIRLPSHHKLKAMYEHLLNLFFPKAK